MKKTKAVLFDFDGVIAETMEDNYQAWRYALKTQGILLKKEEYFLLEGLPSRAIAQRFLDENVSDATLDQVVQSKEETYLKHNQFSLYEGVEAILSALKNKGYLLGMVSGGSHHRIIQILPTEILKRFGVLITSDDSQLGKPHPDPYLKAAKGLGVNPTDCCVVENVPMGIQAAKRAGMFCLAVCSTLRKEYLKEADKVVDKILDLKKIFEID